MSNRPNPIRAAVHQPNFLPWLGFFYKWLNSHVFVGYDDAQFTKGGLINRVRIKSPQGERWITVPVIKKGRLYQPIGEVEIDHKTRWRDKILGTVRSCYCRAPHFDRYFPALAAILSREFRLLLELNLELLTWVSGELGIETRLVRSSRLPGLEGKSTQRLVSVCRAVNADRYLSGFGGSKYQEAEIFKQNGIELAVYDFRHPVYPQLWGEFVPGLSVVDLLFNCGPESGDILRKPAPPQQGGCSELSKI